MDYSNLQASQPCSCYEQVNITNAIIDDIPFNQANRQILISYSECTTCPQRQILLNIDRNTHILDENGNRIPPRDLQIGMTINAVISSAMTRSIPPQAQAFHIHVKKSPSVSKITIGFILDVNNQPRAITTISNQNPSSIITFNLTPDTIILDRAGRNIPFQRLVPGARVRVGHANFMTASIPPQTTAYSIQLL